MHFVAWWPTIICVSIATVTDVRSRRIPDWLVFPFLILGMAVSCLMNGWSGLAQSTAGLLLGATLMGLFYFAGGMGMGDVKLCAAIGAWIGARQLVFALVFMGLAGGVMAFTWAASGGFLKEVLDGTGDLIAGVKERGLRRHPTLVLTNPRARKMPYAPAIAIGTILSFFAVS